ncbi:MAG: LysM peptidoglycan-binding domain-containing protein [Parachlamydiaceae bacterium]|nr:LysM peptidoglycan-binding domain-containing protein [Parachlamydiaceae bacterium]
MQYFYSRKPVSLIFLALFFGGEVHARPQGIPVPMVSVQQMRSDISELQRYVTNQEVEIHQINEKFLTIETIVDAIRRQLSDSSSAHKEQLQFSNVSIETRMASLERTVKGIVADIHILKAHLNDTSSLQSDYKQQFAKYEKLISSQNQNIEKMQTALKSVMELLQTSDESDSADLIYQVKPGDSLEKIANTHGTTVKALKDLNQLSIDRIKIGQKLKLPPK